MIVEERHEDSRLNFDININESQQHCSRVSDRIDTRLSVRQGLFALFPRKGGHPTYTSESMIVLDSLEEADDGNIVVRLNASELWWDIRKSLWLWFKISNIVLIQVENVTQNGEEPWCHVGNIGSFVRYTEEHTAIHGEYVASLCGWFGIKCFFHRFVGERDDCLEYCQLA